MKTITIYGASDDLIEIEGDIREEFSPHEDGEPDYLAFSDGTVLSILYGEDGNWNIKRLTIGTASYQHHKADGDEYTDKVTLQGDLTWCVCGPSFQRAA
jgi:hypothetical protein